MRNQNIPNRNDITLFIIFALQLNVVDRIHIRRTDKIREAQYQPVEKYMQHVIKWYDNYNNKTNFNGSKKVYVATDQFRVLSELKSK